MSIDGKIFVESSKALNGVLRFQSLDERFNEAKDEFLDRYDTLTNWSHLTRLDQKARELGLEFEFVDDDAVYHHQFLSDIIGTEFKCSSSFLDKYTLYPFQSAGINLSYFSKRTLVQWDTGSGKTVLATLVLHRLLEEDQIDLAIVFCKKSKLVDWTEFISEYSSTAQVRRIEGARKKRHEEYIRDDYNVLVTNYEKARYPTKTKDGKHDWSKTDLFELLKLIKGKRVLVVMDEAQKVGNSQSLVSRGLRGMCNSKSTAGKATGPESVRIIALTATPYTTSPYNIHNIFKIIAPGLPYVSTTKKEFEEEYVQQFNLWGYPDWNEKALPKLGKRIENHSHVAMKSDPEIAAQFPEMVEREVSINLSDLDERAYDTVLDSAIDSWSDNSSGVNLQNFGLLRMICNTAESLYESNSPLAAEVLDSLPKTFEPHTLNSEKYNAIAELSETIVEQDEKIVIFSFYVNATLKLYERELRRKFGRHVPVFTLNGQQKLDEQEKNKRGFADAEGGAIFLLSDAGQEGLNLYAPYLAHIEMPYTYASYKQRRDRIHRSDSIANGIEKVWIYRFITHGTVEGPIDNKVLMRKRQSEIIAGKEDVKSERDSLTMKEMFEIMLARKESRTLTRGL